MNNNKEIASQWVNHLNSTLPHSKQWVVEDILAEDNKVIIRAVSETVSAVFMHQIEGGKISDTWTIQQKLIQEDVFVTTMQTLKEVKGF